MALSVDFIFDECAAHWPTSERRGQKLHARVGNVQVALRPFWLGPTELVACDFKLNNNPKQNYKLSLFRKGVTGPLILPQIFHRHPSRKELETDFYCRAKNAKPLIERLDDNMIALVSGSLLSLTVKAKRGELKISATYSEIFSDSKSLIQKTEVIAAFAETLSSMSTWSGLGINGGGTGG